MKHFYIEFKGFPLYRHPHPPKIYFLDKADAKNILGKSIMLNLAQAVDIWKMNSGDFEFTQAAMEEVESLIAKEGGK